MGKSFPIVTSYEKYLFLLKAQNEHSCQSDVQKYTHNFRIQNEMLKYFGFRTPFVSQKESNLSECYGQRENDWHSQNVKIYQHFSFV